MPQEEFYYWKNIVCLIKKTHLDQPRFNVLIIHELGEDEKLLPEELECKVHLKRVKPNHTLRTARRG